MQRKLSRHGRSGSIEAGNAAERADIAAEITGNQGNRTGPLTRKSRHVKTYRQNEKTGRATGCHHKRNGTFVKGDGRGEMNLKAPGITK